VLAVGIQRFAGHEKLEALENAPAEAKEVLSLLRSDAEPLVGDEASKINVLARLSTAGWAHFATHGRFVTSNPSASHLVLTDGRLTVEELRGKDLRQLSGLVLSACQTALQSSLPGQELVGLPSALLLAGVGRVIAPLWKIEDTVSRRFMADFYRALGKGGPAAALAEVQQNWSRDEDEVKSTPNSWGAFVMVGN
jgi:CHAT domain-containing protein